jgi:thiol-disulfide isomerase/thioredoxin
MNPFYILLGIFALVFLCWYIYKKYMVVDNTKFIPNDEYVPANRLNCTITLYHTDWCPHCKEMMPDWTLYKTNYVSDKYDVVFNEIDCDKNPAETSDINEFPTIILTRGETKYFYDSKFSNESMDKFINTIMALAPPK